MHTRSYMQTTNLIITTGLNVKRTKQIVTPRKTWVQRYRGGFIFSFRRLDLLDICRIRRLNWITEVSFRKRVDNIAPVVVRIIYIQHFAKKLCNNVCIGVLQSYNTYLQTLSILKVLTPTVSITRKDIIIIITSSTLSSLNSEVLITYTDPSCYILSNFPRLNKKTSAEFPISLYIAQWNFQHWLILPPYCLLIVTGNGLKNGVHCGL